MRSVERRDGKDMLEVYFGTRGRKTLEPIYSYAESSKGLDFRSQRQRQAVYLSNTLCRKASSKEHVSQEKLCLEPRSGQENEEIGMRETLLLFQKRREEKRVHRLHVLSSYFCSLSLSQLFF